MTLRTGVRYTADYLWDAPDDGNRYEVIDGELYVTTAPDWMHQYSSANLHLLLGSHVKHHQLGYVVAAPVGVVLSPGVGVQPDLVFVSRERADIIRRRGIEGVPDLVVEILSPGTRATDRGDKMRTYARAGIPHYWILDPETRSLSAYRTPSAQGGRYEQTDTHGPGTVFRPGLFPGLEISIDDLWA